jgi:hypothetical protein
MTSIKIMTRKELIIKTKTKRKKKHYMLTRYIEIEFIK